MELQDCIDHLQLADHDRDAALSRLEYTIFTNDLFDDAFKDIFLFPFDNLPQPIKDTFQSLSSPCADDSNSDCQEENCCTSDGPVTIPLAGLYDPLEYTPPDQIVHLWQVCNETEHAMEEDDLPQSSAPATSQISARQAPIQTIPQCFVTLTLTDDGDGLLSEAEYVTFVNVFGGNAWSGATFSAVPESLQQVFSSRTRGNSGVNIEGSIPGSATSDQAIFLETFCYDTFNAINNALPAGTPTATPQQTPPPVAAPATVPETATIPIPEGVTISGPEPATPSIPATPAPTSTPGVQVAPGDEVTTPGPTMSQNLCFIALRLSDRDGNTFLGQTEYTAFVNQISGRKFNDAAFADLPQNLQSKYADLSSSDSGVNVLGADPSSGADAAQIDFLRRVCSEVDQEIAAALNPAPTTSGGSEPTFGFTLNPVESPTPAPGVVPTPQPTTVTRPTFGRPTIPTATPVGSPTQPPSEAPEGTPLPTPAAPTRPPFGLTTPPPTSAAARTAAPVAASPTFPPLTTPAPSTAATQPPTTPATKPPTTAAPQPAPSESPTIAAPPPTAPPTLPPTTPPSQAPTSAPTVPPSPAPTPNPTTDAPTIRPEAKIYRGRVAFKMSNSLLLDQDHLVSGERRNDLNEAFRNMTERIATAELKRGNRRRRRSRRRRTTISLLRPPTRHPLSLDNDNDGRDGHYRSLTVDYYDAHVTNITDMECPPGVPGGTLCQLCEAEFSLAGFDEGDAVMEGRVESLEVRIDEAIRNGELQDALDDVQPDTPLRIEEGEVRQRGTPPGYLSLAAPNLTTKAAIGAGAAALVLILLCMWCWGFCCCLDPCCGGSSATRGNGKGKQKQEVKETASKQPQVKKGGWFS